MGQHGVTRQGRGRRGGIRLRLEAIDRVQPQDGLHRAVGQRLWDLRCLESFEADRPGGGSVLLQRRAQPLPVTVAAVPVTCTVNPLTFVGVNPSLSSQDSTAAMVDTDGPNSVRNCPANNQWW